MTDVTVADAGGAPAAAPASEVPINPNPVSTPSPVGSQAPDAPTGDFEGSKHRPESRRESLQRAIDRAFNPPAPQRRAPEQRPAPKAAEARPGHNNPPEETPKDKPIDLRRPPPKDAQQREPQPRDRGRFAPREQAATATVPPGQPIPAQQSQAQQQQRPAGNFVEPPARMAEHAKRDWARTPESVRGEYHRMHQEYAKAYQTYRAAAEAFQPIARYHELARQHGTTLEQALGNYTSMEAKLRGDLVAGLDQIVYNLNRMVPDGQGGERRLNIRDVAYHILTQTPEQLRTAQLGNNQQAAQHQIGQLHQQIAGLQNTVQQMQDRQQFIETRGAVDQFADQRPRFDELGAVIEQELKFGFDLPTAYRRAELLNPTAHAAQTRTPSAQTRTPDRSISGGPGVAPSNGASRRPREPSPSPREAAANAARRLGMLI